jgi:hypothetical protein
MVAQWARKWDYCDSQEVGLEAAILERVRNSSLVEWSCADNVTGLSYLPRQRISNFEMVEERSHSDEAAAVRHRGAVGSENAGMSSV